MKSILLTISLFFLYQCNALSETKIFQKNEQAPTIIIYRTGKPNLTYIHAYKYIASRWGINVKFILPGCIRMRDSNEKYLFYKEKNQIVYTYYDKKFGIDWKQKFQKEIAEEVLKMKKYDSKR